MKNTNSFLCQNCKDGMCEDCISIAEEYQNLLEMRTNALVVANYQVEQLSKAIEKEQRKSAMYENVAKAGFADVICAWMDLEISQLLDSEKVIQ